MSRKANAICAGASDEAAGGGGAGARRWPMEVALRGCLVILDHSQRGLVVSVGASGGSCSRSVMTAIGEM